MKKFWFVLCITCSFLYMNLAYSSTDWVPPELGATFTTSCPGSLPANYCDPSLTFNDESQAFNYASNNVANDLQSRIVKLVSIGPIELYSANKWQSVYKYNYTYKASWYPYPDLTYYRSFVIAPAAPRYNICPASHPLAYDPDGNGEIDACFVEQCPDNGQASTPAISNEYPGLLGLVGNPIRCASGEKVESTVIYQGSGADPLSYSSHYTSAKYEEETSSLGQFFASHQGNQRNDNFARKLELIFDQNGGKVYKISGKSGLGRLYFGNSTSATFTGINPKSGVLNLESDGTFTNVKPDGTIYTFNVEGTIKSVVLPSGRTRLYGYDSNGKITSVTNHYGQQLQYFYNANSLLNKIIDPDNNEYLFEYDSINNMTKIIFPDDTPSNSTDNPFIEYLFENVNFPNHLTGKINENGVRLATWNYDLKGRAISSEHSVGLEKVELDFSVENQTRVTTHVADNLSNDVIYHYSTKNISGNKRKLLDQYEQLICSDCTVGSWQYEYNAAGYVSKSTSPNGTVTLFEYDSNGLEVKRIDAQGTSNERVTETSWDSTSRRILSQTINNLKVESSYNSQGLMSLSTITDLSDNKTKVTEYTYVTPGLISKIDGPRTDVNDVTNMAYDGDGNIQAVFNALGHSITFADYDASGRVGTIHDANGIETSLTYTPRGWLESSTTNGATTQYQYELTGSLKLVTSPNGLVMSYEYDDGERVIAVVDSLGNRIEYIRDLMGNVVETKIKDPSGVLTQSQRSVFNGLGQLTKALSNYGQSTEVSYDAENNPVSDKNALNNVSSSNFDSLNRLIKSIDPDNGETNYTYNSQNLITSVSDPENKATNYEYNAFGELTKLTSPDTGISTFTYDQAGNLLSKTDARGITVTFTYDALNRVNTQVYSDASENITYVYDDVSNDNKGIGRLTSVTDKSGSTAYFYDAFGNVTKETRVIDGVSYVTEYHFDANGQMTGVTYPSGRTLTYLFDALGRVSGLTSDYNQQVKTLASDIAYLPFGPMTSLTYGNNKILTQEYDLDYRLTDKSVSGIAEFNYAYDLTNNITTISNSLDAANDESFTYDKLSRLLLASGGYGEFGYTYDKVGNRLSKTENSEVDTYQYASTSHRLTSISGANPRAFTHDAAGNTLVKDDLSFTYNKQGRMATASKVGMNANYVYNFKGERNFKLVNGVETHFIYDLQGQLIAEADGNGVIQKEYIYINGQRLATVTDGVMYYVHTNHLDTPFALTDEAGEVQWKANYTPFGEVVVAVNNVAQDARFPGQYYDAETGLHYNYFRDYDPELGRYITSDPLGLAAGMNTYGYVGQDPINYIDPTGLDRWDIDYANYQNGNYSPAYDFYGEGVKDPCGCAAKVFGIETAAGATAAASGLPVIPYPRTGVGAGSSTGATSVASRTLSSALPQRLPVRVPTPTIKNPRAGSRVLGRVLGRFVPYAGWGLLINDFIQLADCLAKCEEDGECK